MTASSSFHRSDTSDPKGPAEQVQSRFEEPLDDDEGFELSGYAVKKKWQGTEADRREMSALGRVQQLRVSSQKESSLDPAPC